MPQVNLDWMISVDDHVLEPPDLWQRWLPEKYKSQGPHIIEEDGEEFWAYDGKKIATESLAAVAGKDREDWTDESIRYSEMRRGCYDPVARAKDMDEAGVLASICFPSFPRFCGQVFWEGDDKELGLACVEAYNNFQIEEWAGSAPGRFIPIIILPLWDPVLAAAEVRRSFAAGARALAFSENPTKLGLPSIYDTSNYWDPLWEACNETGMVVCMHIGSSSTMWAPSDLSPGIVRYITAPPTAISGAMTEWIFGPPFQKFPNLKIALAEGGIGWMPYFLERCEYTVAQHRSWMMKGTTLDASEHAGVPDLMDFDVRETFRKHVYGCYINDEHGAKNIRSIGVDNVMAEMDYPHADSTWPDSISFAQKQLELTDLSDQEKYKVLRGNAERVFQFTPAEIPILGK
ncbi:amidohydrolase family protein [Nocardia pseudovaccinii]|uniref:amidohydrolase family protein n=1 Tax=Nocardia pseudovaccinii TaxID=189540 RepID=UPI003D928BEF